GVSIVNISNGTYHLTEVPNGDYILVLTTEKPSIGAVAPMPNLPENWKYMGENVGAGPGDDGTVDGRLRIHIEDKDVKNANFGISQKDNKFFAPNTFSPNGDGLNDSWKIFGNNIKDIEVMVYDQYGQKIFESRDIDVGWDG